MYIIQVNILFNFDKVDVWFKLKLYKPTIKQRFVCEWRSPGDVERVQENYLQNWYNFWDIREIYTCKISVRDPNSALKFNIFMLFVS